MFEQFLRAQNDAYSHALKEIESGRKRTQWMWFIFPEIKECGMTDREIWYSLNDAEEAKKYLEHPLLGKGLREICQALLALGTNNPTEVFGSIDDMKLRSCMTLFDVVEPESVFDKVLTKFFDGKRDEKTLRILRENPINYRIMANSKTSGNSAANIRMKVNSIDKVLNLISSLDVAKSELNFEIRRFDCSYELTAYGYTIYFDDCRHLKEKYLEIVYNLGKHIYIKLSNREIVYFRIIFNSLLTNYLRNRWIQDHSADMGR